LNSHHARQISVNVHGDVNVPKPFWLQFYRLTPEGKKQLLREQSRWAELVHAISRVMTPVPAPASEE